MAALEAVVCVPLPLPLRLGAARGALSDEGSSTLMQGGGGPALLQAPPLLILTGPSYEALQGLQLDVRGDEVSCALLQGESAFPLDPHLPKLGRGPGFGGAALLWGGFFPPFIPFCLVVVEEDKELALKEEEVLPCEAPPEAPRQPSPPVAAEDGDGGDASAIIYEIPQEPEKSVVVGGGF